MSRQPSYTGVLADLDAAIAALGPCADRDPALARALRRAQRMRSVLVRPPRVALAGEFSSGKSSLVNMLLGAGVIPTAAVASALPTIHLSYGEEAALVVTWPDGQRARVTSEDLKGADYRRAHLLEVALPVPFLREVELLDTPGTGDPSRDVEQMSDMVRRAHIVLWCTNATQAWRESERRKWISLPKRLRATSILVVTHVDLPRVRRSLGRLLTRLEEDTQGLFCGIRAISTLDAMSSRDEDGRVTDAQGWENSGGAALISALHEVASRISEAQRASAERHFAVRIAPLLGRAEEVARQPARPAASGAAKCSPPIGQDLLRDWRDALDRIDARLGDHPDPDPVAVARECLETVVRFEGGLPVGDGPAATDAARFGPRLAEARAAFVRWSQQLPPNEAARLCAATLVQLEWELAELSRAVPPTGLAGNGARSGLASGKARSMDTV